MATSSLCRQLWRPQPLWGQLPICVSYPAQSTSSSQMRPLPGPYRVLPSERPLRLQHVYRVYRMFRPITTFVGLLYDRCSDSHGNLNCLTRVAFTLNYFCIITSRNFGWYRSVSYDYLSCCSFVCLQQTKSSRAIFTKPHIQVGPSGKTHEIFSHQIKGQGHAPKFRLVLDLVFFLNRP